MMTRTGTFDGNFNDGPRVATTALDERNDERNDIKDQFLSNDVGKEVEEPSDWRFSVIQPGGPQLPTDEQPDNFFSPERKVSKFVGLQGNM